LLDLQWGYYQHELLEQDFSYILFQADYQQFADAIKSTKKSSFEHHARINRGDHRTMDCLWFIDWSAQLGKFFAACEDITDRMNLERARSDFIAQLTHDMRSPLTIVSMSLELISENTSIPLPVKVRNIVVAARASLSRVLQLINDILDGEKLRHSRHALEMSSVDIVRLCKSALAEISSMAVESKIRLALTLDSEAIFVRADEKLLRRVVANLLSNAVSFSPEGSCLGFAVTISSDSAMVKISDEGPGIHQDYHSAIFERFGAPKSSTMQNRPSTGIGLSFCRDIVIAHGGLIGVDSELGKGSTFWFTIPLDNT
jgi:signal transduction histidine kinase